MTGLKRKLTIKDGLALGIGSIMGSGILFLPSLTYQLAGSDVLLAWSLTTLFCLPLLLIFSDMVKTVPNEHGISGFIQLGLGSDVAATIPILMLGTVGLGMPSAAMIAGRYFARMVGAGVLVEVVTALSLVFIAIAANVRGVRSSSRMQSGVAFALFGLAVALLAITMPVALPKVDAITPEWNLQKILAGSVVAFWAYAGFENMTFTAGEFRRPHRDIIASITLSLVLCAGLYIGLTAHYAALIPKNSVDTIVGLSQLAEYTPHASVVSILVTLLALGAVLINLSSWSWGISRLVYAAAGEGALPKCLHKLSEAQVPKRALIAMLILFSTVILVGAAKPDLFDVCLQMVSTNFVVLYLLCLASYVSYSAKLWKKTLGVLLALILCICLTSSGWLVIYPLALISIAYAFAWLRRKRGRSV